MKTTLIILFLRLQAMLPLQWNRAIGSLLGRLALLSGARMVRTTRTNLQLCFPDMPADRRERLVRASVRHTMQAVMEAGPVWLLPVERSLSLIRGIDNFDLLVKARDAGKGLLIMSPHIGNWELLGLYLNTCGLGQNYQLYQEPENRELGKLIFAARSRSGSRMVATDNRGVAELLRALRGGETAGILPDQVPNDAGGEFAPFYGIPALTMTLPVRLQQKTGACIVMGYARRMSAREGGGFRLVFREPDPMVYAEDMPTALEGLNRSIQLLIDEAPEQYHWEYKKFKRQPPGRPRVY